MPIGKLWVGLLLASCHFLLWVYVVVLILAGHESAWPMYWNLFVALDFPVSMGIYLFALVPLHSGDTPIGDLNNFWVPALYFGIVGTSWWYMLGVLGPRYIKWLRRGNASN